MLTQEVFKTREILAKYKSKCCKKPEDQCKFKTFAQKDIGEIVVLCTGFHNIADERRSPFVDNSSNRVAYSYELCDKFDPATNACPHSNCDKCRNTFEFNYHPDNFKKTKCPYFESKRFCRLGVKCFRYHEKTEYETWRTYWEGLKNSTTTSIAGPVSEPRVISSLNSESTTITREGHHERRFSLQTPPIQKAPPGLRRASGLETAAASVDHQSSSFSGKDKENMDVNLSDREQFIRGLYTHMANLSIEDKEKSLGALESKVDACLRLYTDYKKAIEEYRGRSGLPVRVSQHQIVSHHSLQKNGCVPFKLQGALEKHSSTM